MQQIRRPFVLITILYICDTHSLDRFSFILFIFVFYTSHTFPIFYSFHTFYVAFICIFSSAHGIFSVVLDDAVDQGKLGFLISRFLEIVA